MFTMTKTGTADRRCRIQKAMVKDMIEFGPKHRVWAVLLPSLVVAGCALPSPLRMNPEFANGKHTVTKVAVLPPDVVYHVAYLNGNRERVPRKEQALRTEFETKLARSLEGRGYQVRKFTADEIEKKLAGANSIVEQIKDAYRSAAARVLYARPVPDGEARKFRVSMGPLGSDLGKVLDADAFLLTHYQGYGQSKGLAAAELGTAALTVIAGGTPAGGSTPLPSMELALVEAATGNIMWANRSHSPSPG